MIASNLNSLCKQAELYYYDFLFGESRGLIPGSIIKHIEQCEHCREQLNQLECVLSHAEGDVEPQQRQIDSAVTTMLKLHFAYIGKPVTCETTKPFLPSLLDPALEIRIPTPITAHLDNCRKCSEDLETIRRLNLNRKQLRRLSQLFAENPDEDAVSCSEAQVAVPWVALLVFGKANAGVLKHLCTCPDCRKLLYEYRGTVCEEYRHEKIERKEFPCDEVSESDIFDYVVPYGLDPADDQYAKFRKSFTTHASACPNCLAKMQQLHDTVYGIRERAESEVVTIYHIEQSAKAGRPGEPDDLYAGFPIRVEVADSKGEVKPDESVSTVDFDATRKRRFSATNLKPLAKIAAVAAVVLIAVALLLYTPTAKAITIDQIYKALEKVTNVHISRFVPPQAEPTQEKWVSRALSIYMTKTGKQVVLSDIPNRVRKSKQLDTIATETYSLTNDDVADLEKKMTGSLGLMPFSDISKVLPDSEWSRITDDGLEGVFEGIEVYDLISFEKAYDGSVTFSKCRVFVDSKTNLPQKTEFYEKPFGDSEYTLALVMVVEYLSDSEIRTVIKDVGF